MGVSVGTRDARRWLADAPTVDRAAAFDLVRGFADRIASDRGLDGYIETVPTTSSWLSAAPADARTPQFLGVLWETLLDADRRRRRGAHFTPPHLTGRVVRAALDAWGGSSVPRVWDPACGGGAFLLAAAEELQARGAAPVEVVTSLFGTEIDADTAGVARLALGLWADGAGEPSIVVGDALQATVLSQAPFDIVVGNPPFLSQLDARTARNRERDSAVREALGLPPTGLADEAALFLELATQSLGDGGVASLVLPQSVLGASDSEVIRERVGGRCRLVWLWAEEQQSFAADVDIVVLSLRRDSSTLPLRAQIDDGVAVSVPQPTARSWAPALAVAKGTPFVDLAGPPLSSWASVTAGFRQHYYGIVDAVADAGTDETGSATRPRLITAGAIDLLHDRWGQKPITFAKTRRQRPVVELSAIEDQAVQTWFRARLVPKLLVASQTRVLEAVVDVDGIMVPSVPVLSVEPIAGRAADLDALAAVFAAPAASAWLASRAAGTGLSADAMRVRAATLAELPLPTDSSAWEKGAELARSARLASSSGDHDTWGRRLAELAKAMTAAYETSADVTVWWRGRGRFLDH